MKTLVKTLESRACKLLYWSPAGGMEAKDEAKDESKDAKGAAAPRGALHVVAEHYEKLKNEAESALSVSTSNSVLIDADGGIELVYSDFVEENADEFEGAAEALADGRGHDHSLKALHDEFLALFERDAERVLASSGFEMDEFQRALGGLAAADGSSAPPAVEQWFVDAALSLLDYERFARVMAAAAARQRALMERKRAFRALRRAGKGK